MRRHRAERALLATARVRQYNAEIRQAGASLLVKLTGATFAEMADRGGSAFPGQVQAARVTFSLKWLDSRDCCDYPNLVEVTDGSTYLVIDGAVSVTVGASVSGRLDGTFYVLDWDPRLMPTTQTVAGCYSSQHHFMLSR